MGAGYSGFSLPSFINTNITNNSIFNNLSNIAQIKLIYTITVWKYYDPGSPEEGGDYFTTTIQKIVPLYGSFQTISLNKVELFGIDIDAVGVSNVIIDYELTLDNAYKFTSFASSIGTPTVNTNNLISGQLTVPLENLYVYTWFGVPVGLGLVNVYDVATINTNFTVDINLTNAVVIEPIVPVIDAIVPTETQILTQTVTKNAFALVESGLTLCQIEALKTIRLNEILNNIQTLRNYSRDTGSTTTYNNNGSLNQAGSRYTENFPSAKFANSVGINELLLNKKRYMFSNSLNKNVVSGPVAFNTLSGYSNTLPYNAGSSGLTKVQQFANAARGRTLSGGPGRRYGVQFYDGRSLVSIPNIYNQTTQPTQPTQPNQTINICAFT